MRSSFVPALAALCAALGTGAATASAQEPLPVADALSANTQTFVNDNFPSAPYLPAMAAAGVTGARSDAFWANVEPSAPTGGAVHNYDWTKFDAIKARYDAGGVRWMPILESSPAWARDPGKAFLSPPNPAHYGDFTAFARAFAERYGPGGAKAGAFPVEDIEIYNEENEPRAGAYTASPADFGQIYTAGRVGVKAAQSSIRVIVGAVLYDTDPANSSPPITDVDYIKGIFSSPGFAGADGIALHPYAPTAIGVANNIRRMQGALIAIGQGSLPVYVNELGYPAALDGATPAKQAALGPTTDESRAGTVAFMTDALLASDCSVRNIAYFDLVSQETNKADTSYLDSETWKGLERKSDASLTVTGKAYRDSGVRWRANPVPGTMHLCGTPGAGTAPLPIDLKVEKSSASCLHATVTYRGFPLEQATVFFTKPDGNTASAPWTWADGSPEKDFCADDGKTYVVQADVNANFVDVPRFAISGAVACKMSSTASCAPTVDSPLTQPGKPGATTTTTTSDGTGVLTQAGTCLLQSFKVTGSTRVSTVLKKGLKVRASGCKKVATGDASKRRVTISATVTNAVARSLKLTRKRSKKAYKVGSGARQVSGAPDMTIVVRFTKSARSRLRRAKSVKLALSVQVTEGAAYRRVSVPARLKR